MKQIFHFVSNNWDVIVTVLGAIFYRAKEKPTIERKAVKNALHYVETGELEEPAKSRFWELYKQTKK